MKKVKKNIGKAFRKKRFKKYFKKAWKELKEEAEDFYEDFFEKKEVHKKLRKVKLHGTNILVKPAYVFAQRIEGLMHFWFINFCFCVNGNFLGIYKNV